MRLSARPCLVDVNCCWLDPSSYSLAFRLNDTVCRVACPLLPGFQPPLLSSIYTLSALQVTVMVPSGSLLRYHVESSRCGRPSGSSLSQSSIGQLALPPPSWCGAFLLTRSVRRLLLSIYPYLLRDGVTLRVECGFSPTRSKRSLLWISGLYSFRMGSPFFGSESNVLISSEGIPTVGLLGAFFLPVLWVCFCHPLVGRSALKRGGFHIQLSSLLARALWLSL